MPEQVSNSHGSKVFYKGDTQKTKKFPRTKIFIWCIVAIITSFITAGSALIGASYLSVKAPLISSSLQRKVDYLVASVPLIPKTSKQILTKASQDTQNIKTAKQKFTASIKSGGKKIAALEITSQIDETNLDNVKLSGRVKGDYAIGEVQQLDFSLVEIGSDLYFKLDQIPPIPSYNLEAIKGDWYKIDIEEMTEELKADIRSSEGIKEDIEEQQEKLFSFLEDNKIFKKIERLPDEEVGGRGSYHYQLILDEETLVKIFQEIYPGEKVDKNEIRELIEETKLDFWVDKRTFFVDKLELSVRFTTQAAKSFAAAGLPITDSLQAVLSYELSDLNQPLQLEAPKKATKIDSVYELFMKIQPSSLPLEQGILGISKTTEFGSNVLFLERIVNVVTLFPSSI